MPQCCLQLTIISNPRSLCEHLISECLAAGVKLHQPCRPISVSQPSGDKTYIELENSSSHERTSIHLTSLVIAAGAWSSSVIGTLFPDSPPFLQQAISSLAGHALVLRSPSWPPPALDNTDHVPTGSGCHAVFTTEAEGGYSPEIFSRMPNGEIYLAGLNSSTYPLPSEVDERVIDPAAIAILKKTARRLCGDKVEVLRESVCWRPVTQWGTPVVHGLSNILQSNCKVILAAGHGAWGISLSLGTGYCVAGMVQAKDMSKYVAGLGF